MNEETRRFMWTFILASVVAWFIFGWVCYSLGAESEAQLTLDSIDNAEYATELLRQCMDTNARAMSEILKTDAYLWERIRELPAIVTDR